MPLSPASPTVNSCPEVAAYYNYFMIQSLPSFCRGRLVSLYAWEVLATWQGPHTHLRLMLRIPNGTSFNHALWIMISDFGSITCQKCFNLPWVEGSSIDAAVYPEKQLLIFSLPTPNIHSSFYLPHNIEMKEAKSVCPLESIVTTAITQVIWPKLRHSAGFSMPWFQGNRKRKEWFPRKQSALKALPGKGHGYILGYIKANFSLLLYYQREKTPVPLACFKCPHVCSVWMLPTAGGDN